MLLFNLLSLLAVASALVVPPQQDDKSALEKKSDSKVIELALKYEGRQYHADVRLGSEGKLYRPLIDSGSWATWFPDEDQWAFESTSLVNLTTPFSVAYMGSTSASKGYFVKDTLQFDNAKSEGVQFGILENPSQFKQGLLAIARLQGTNYDTVPYHLKTAGQVERTVSSLWYSTLRDTGKLTFGGYDRAKVGSEWTSHYDPLTFKVPVVKVTTNGVDHFPDYGDYPIVVDTGAPNSLLPRAIVEPIAEFYNAKRVGKEYEVSCDPPAGLFQITLGNLTLDIDLKSFVHQAPGKANGICTIGASIAEDRGNVTLIGTTLINEVVTLFDYENGVVSMAKLNDTPEEDLVFLEKGQSI